MTAHICAENDILHQSGVELVCLLYSEAIARISSALDRIETSRRLIEQGALRAKIEDLQRLRAGFRQLRPIHTALPSLDVRL